MYTYKVLVESHRTGKYGRWLGVITPLLESGEAAPVGSVNDALLAAGHAVPYMV